MNKKHRRLPRLLIIGAVLLALLTANAFAILSAYNRSPPEHTFKPAEETDPSILEGSDGNTFNGIMKEQVKVDVGDPGYAVYVRAAIVVNWEQNGDENKNHFHATAPVAGTDYTISLNTGADDPWFLGTDGFYYHKAMVSSGATSNLIETCKVVSGKAPDGYHLDVKIIAQTIQALGTTDAVDANGNPTPAVEDAWKVVTVDNNLNLTPKT